MSYRKISASIGKLVRLGIGMSQSLYYKYGGLSDKQTPINLSHIESPDLLNVDFSNGNISRRNGYTEVASGFKDASLFLDGFNDYATIAHKTAYQPTGTQGIYIGLGVVLKSTPITTASVLARGYSTAGHAFRLHYTPATFTWTMSVYNAAGVATDYTIVDTVGGVAATNYFRYFEWYQYGTGVAATFKAWADDGTVLTSSVTTAMASFFVSTEPTTIGKRLSSALTITAGDSSVNCSVFDYRYAVVESGSDSTLHICSTGNTRYKRELTPTETTFFTGYWKLNDGRTDGILTDSTTGVNHGELPVSNSATWNTTTTEVVGTAGIRFRAGEQCVLFSFTGAGYSAVNPVFQPDTTGAVAWAMTVVFKPDMPPGYTTYPDQCILWSGINAGMGGLPAPFGIRIVANRVHCYYNDAGVLRDIAVGATLDTYAPFRRLRIWFARDTRYGPNPLTATLMVDVNDWTSPGVYVNTSPFGVSGAVTTVTPEWTFGRHRTSLLPSGTGYYTFDTDGGTYGTISSFRLYEFRGISVAGNTTPINTLLNVGPTLSFTETPSFWGGNIPTTILHIPFDEGSGSYIGVVNSALIVLSATLFPQEKDAGRWDVGYMIPYTPPEITSITPRYKLTAAGTYTKEILVVSGCGLYSVNPDTGVVTPVGADFYKGRGTWTSTKYADKVFYATNNGMRPIVYDQHGVRFLGIEAPTAPPTVTLSNAAGTFVAGSYVVYYTFRNKSSGEESNPSPGTTITFVAPNDTIDSIYVPTSPNRWVTQRRIYITALNGTTIAYYAVDIDDNTTTNYTTDIVTPPASGVTMELYKNQVAPQASIVAIYKDYLFAAGESVYPTRVYRNSRAGAFWAWDKDELYVDLDLDSGDPVTSLMPLNDSLIADVRDGRYSISVTGSASSPFNATLIQRGSGCVWHTAATPVLTEIFYFGETDIYVTDGYQTMSVSTTDGQTTLPSIQHTMRTGINHTRRNSIVAALYQPRNQVWFAYSTAGNGRNNQILVYDKTYRNWSKYDIPADYIAAIDDGTDIEKLYAGIFGKLYKLDTGTVDGLSTLAGASVTSVSGQVITVAGTPFSSYGATGLEGRRVHLYRAATADVIALTIYAHTSSTLTVYESTTGIASGDVLGIGLIPFYIDFNFDFGDPQSVKRLRWMRLTGTSSNASNLLRITYKSDYAPRLFSTQTGATNIFNTWTDTETYKLLQMGGLGRFFRIRLAEAGVTGLTPTLPLPSIAGTLSFDGITIEAENTDLL